MAENMTAGAANEAMVTETIHVTEARIACDGGGGPLGHPRVWLTLGTDGEIICPYCSPAMFGAPAGMMTRTGTTAFTSILRDNA